MQNIILNLIIMYQLQIIHTSSVAIEFESEMLRYFQKPLRLYLHCYNQFVKFSSFIYGLLVLFLKDQYLCWFLFYLSSRFIWLD